MRWLRHRRVNDPLHLVHIVYSCGLPGYLILFAPHAFAPQRQYLSRVSPSPPVFLPISTNFTSTPGIPHSPPVLKPASFRCTSTVEPWAFTSDLVGRLRALYAQ